MKINEADVAFVIDTTGSMGGFIAQAKARLVQILTALSRSAHLDLRFGLVEYRDHPPQEQTFVTRRYDFTVKPDEMQQVINKLTVAGGGDTPEAVFAGVHEAVTRLSWRPHSARYALLVGDAPPHGVGCGGDGFASGCPSGLDTRAVCAAAEEARVTLHALMLNAAPVLVRSFGELAHGTGGQAVLVENTGEVVGHIERMLRADFADLELDARVLELTASHGLDPEELARQGGWSRPQVSRALARLGQRGFFD